MPEAKCVLITPPTNTSATRRRFLTNAAGIAAGGTALALAAIPPTSAAAAPTGALDPANAGPALRAATRALGDADDRLKQARAAFDAADKLPEDWRRLNPQPTAGRALKRWNRREREYRYSVVMPRWQALLAAEDDFRDAMMAVAMIKSLDMGELALKACLSSVYDEVRLSWPSGAPIGSSVAIDLLALTLRATSCAKGMKITRVEKPLPPPAAAIWHGTSIDGSRNLQWFYWPRHWLHVREQDEINPRCWMNVDPPPGAKRAVLKAIRGARRGLT